MAIRWDDERGYMKNSQAQSNVPGAQFSMGPNGVRYQLPPEQNATGSFYSNAATPNIYAPQTPTTQQGAPNLYGPNPYAGTGSTQTVYDIPADDIRVNPDTGQTEYYDVAARRWRPNMLASTAKAYGTELYKPSEQEAAFRDAQYQMQQNQARQSQSAPKVITQQVGGGMMQDYVTQNGELVPWGEPYNETQSPNYKPYFQLIGTDDNGNMVVFDARTGETKTIEAEGMVNPLKKSTASATERKELSGIYTLLDKTDRINELYKPNYVGLTSGPAGRATQQLEGNEKQFREFVDSLKDDLLRAKSGAQINEQEYKRLTAFLPNYTDTNEAFKASVARFQWELNNMLENKRRTFEESGVYFGPNVQGQGDGQGNIQNIGGLNFIVDENGNYIQVD